MSTNSPPSVNPANRGTLVGLLKLAMTKFLQNTDDMLPAKVIGYDRATNRAQAQPLIAVVTTDNQQVPRAQVASVPVYRFGAGGFFVSFLLKPGNTGWLKAADRDTSIFQQTGQASPPNTQRKHSFSDGMFFPDIMTESPDIAEENAAACVIQSIDGSVCIALDAGKITITAPNINFVGNVGITGAFSNNGVNIGSTHVHTEVETGVDDSGPPLS